MKAFQVLVILAFSAIVAAKPKCVHEPTDCRYNAEGELIEDLSYLVAYIRGLGCTNNRQPVIVEISGMKFICCNPPAPTTECEEPTTPPPPTTTTTTTTPPPTTTTTTTTPPPTTTTTTTTPPPTTTTRTTTPPPTTTTTTTTPPPTTTTTTTTPPPTTTTTTTTPPPTTTTTTTTPPPTTTTTTTTPPPTTTTTTTTPPPTTTTTTTTTPPPPTTTTTTTPAPCVITCSNGFADTTDGFCRCCDFDGFATYEELKENLEEVIASYDGASATDTQTDARIAAIQERLEAVKQYVLENCGQDPTAFVSAEFEYITREIRAIDVKVQEFIESLVPNSSCDNEPACPARTPTRIFTDCSCICGVKCNATADEVTLRDRCECIYFEGYGEFYSLRKEFQIIIRELSYILFETEEVTTLITELNNDLREISIGISNFERNYDQTTESEKRTLIETITTKIQGSIEEVNTFLSSGACETLCTRPRVNKASDCSCYTTNVITQFYRKLALFISYESRVNSINYRGDTEMETYFKEWVKNIREMAVDFYKQVTESIFDESSQLPLYEAFAEEVDKLQKEFDDFLRGIRPTTPAPCTISCSGDTVKNCKTCTCASAPGWVRLNNEIWNAIPGLLEEILGLSIDADDSDILYNNAELIRDGITDLRNYITNFCGNLDETFVKLRCLELVGWYEKLTSDIEAIQNPEFESYCTTTCPNSLWNYDPNSCVCSCEVNNCAVPTEAIDPYNCICTPINGCELTSGSCGANQLLDYSNCVCRDQP